MPQQGIRYSYFHDVYCQLSLGCMFLRMVCHRRLRRKLTIIALILLCSLSRVSKANWRTLCSLWSIPTGVKCRLADLRRDYVLVWTAVEFIYLHEGVELVRRASRFFDGLHPCPLSSTTVPRIPTPPLMAPTLQIHGGYTWYTIYNQPRVFYVEATIILCHRRSLA